MQVLRLSEMAGTDPALNDLVQELHELETVAKALELAKHSDLTPEQFQKECEGRFGSTEAPGTVEDLYAIRKKLVLKLAAHLGVSLPAVFFLVLTFQHQFYG